MRTITSKGKYIGKKMGIVNRVTTRNKAEISATPPYLIAEAGVNHEGSLKIAKRLIEEAAEGGADAI